MTLDPLTSNLPEKIIWDLEDGSPMPPLNTRYRVLKETIDLADDGTITRTIKRITLEEEPA